MGKLAGQGAVGTEDPRPVKFDLVQLFEFEKEVIPSFNCWIEPSLGERRLSTCDFAEHFKSYGWASNLGRFALAS